MIAAEAGPRALEIPCRAPRRPLSSDEGRAGRARSPREGARRLHPDLRHHGVRARAAFRPPWERHCFFAGAFRLLRSRPTADRPPAHDPQRPPAGQCSRARDRDRAAAARQELRDRRRSAACAKRCARSTRWRPRTATGAHHRRESAPAKELVAHAIHARSSPRAAVPFSSRSTARRSPRSSIEASSSATRRARSPARPRRERRQVRAGRRRHALPRRDRRHDRHRAGD